MTNKVSNNKQKSLEVTKQVSQAPDKYIFLEEYRNMLNGKRTPLSEKGMKMFADDLVQWATNEDEAIRLEEFPLTRGVSLKVYYQWLERYEYLKEAHEHALILVGIRRYRKAFNRNASEGIFKHLQHVYDPVWKEANEYHNNLKRDLQDKSTTPTVINVNVSDYSGND